MLDEMAAALDRGRRRLALVDLGNVLELARAAAPERWRRTKRRSRWPIVGVVLLIGAVGAVILFLRPTVRRALDERGSASDLDAPPNTTEGQPAAAPYPANAWGNTSEEKIDGDETGF